MSHIISYDMNTSDYRQTVLGFSLRAINWVKVPRGRVDECKVRYENKIRVKNLEQVATSVVKLFLMELIPPNLALSIDRSIIPCIQTSKI